MIVCPDCGKSTTCAHCTGKQGGLKSRRAITAEQQAKMQKARKQKRGAK